MNLIYAGSCPSCGFEMPSVETTDDYGDDLRIRCHCGNVWRMKPKIDPATCYIVDGVCQNHKHASGQPRKCPVCGDGRGAGCDATEPASGQPDEGKRKTGLGNGGR